MQRNQVDNFIKCVCILREKYCIRINIFIIYMNKTFYLDNHKNNSQHEDNKY